MKKTTNKRTVATVIGAIMIYACTLTATFCFTGCESTSNNSNTGTTAAVTTVSVTTAQKSVITAVKSAIIGSWDSELAPGTVYTFKEDGTGQLDATGSIINFTYTDKSGKVEITYEGTKTPEIYGCTVTDGKLTMNAGDGTSYTYVKK